MPDCQFYDCLARVMPSYQFRDCLASRANPRGTHETLCLEDFRCDLLTFHPYYIYPHYPQKYERLFKEKNPRQVFYNTTHPSFRERESYSSLVRNHFSLFSFPLPLPYLERSFVPKHNPHLFRVQSVLELGKFWGFSKRSW